MEKKTSKLKYQDKPGSKGTFIVKVDHCQCGTWQGKVVWAEENKTKRFRSMLELVRLMDEAMASGQEISIKQQA